MLNMIWTFMILTGILCAALGGRMEAVTNAALSGAGDAIALCLSMAGAVSMWSGFMEIAKESGMMERMTKFIAPFLSFLFPDIPENHPALSQIAVNVVANILGLGWACTPAGLKAMEYLARLERERGNPEYERADGSRHASREMCTFLILNISSLQLVPVNMIAYRSRYGSARPAGIIVPAIPATSVSTLTAVVFCKGMELFEWWKRRKNK
ncbi:MAG: nucleoside recognition protein [Lachnospiraceae bacterium]|nr:nucleoside recognition protein [Lachnospiraceae bacterium]